MALIVSWFVEQSVREGIIVELRLKLSIAALVIMTVVFIAGLVLILGAPYFGSNLAEQYIMWRGGRRGGDSHLNLIFSSRIAAFNTGGIVMSLFGGLGMITSGRAIHHDLGKKHRGRKRERTNEHVG